MRCIATQSGRVFLALANACLASASGSDACWLLQRVCSFFCGAQAASKRTVSNVMRLRMHNARCYTGFLLVVVWVSFRAFSRHSVAVISSMQC